MCVCVFVRVCKCACIKGGRQEGGVGGRVGGRGREGGRERGREGDRQAGRQAGRHARAHICMCTRTCACARAHTIHIHTAWEREEMWEAEKASAMCAE